MQKKTTALVPLVERHKKWKQQQAADESSDEDETEAQKTSNAPLFEFDDEEDDKPKQEKITSTKVDNGDTKKKPKETKEEREKRRKERRERREKRGDKKKKKSRKKPSALTSIIYPAIDKLADSGDDDRLTAALEQLKATFDNAERLHPGISHQLIAQIIDTLKRSAQ